MNWEDRTADYYINRMLRQYDLGELAGEIEVERAYREVVGDFISRLTTRIHYRKGTLRVHYAAAALRQEISLRRESLRLAINQKLGSETIKKIEIR